MAFFPTGQSSRTARVKIVMNKRRRFRWELGSTHGLRWHRLSIDAQRDAVSTYGRDIEITDETGGVRYIP